MSGWQEAELLSVGNSAQVFNLLSDVPGDVQDVDELLQVEQQSTWFARIEKAEYVAVMLLVTFQLQFDVMALA